MISTPFNSSPWMAAEMNMVGAGPDAVQDMHRQRHRGVVRQLRDRQIDDLPLPGRDLKPTNSKRLPHALDPSSRP